MSCLSWSIRLSLTVNYPRVTSDVVQTTHCRVAVRIGVLSPNPHPVQLCVERKDISLDMKCAILLTIFL